MAVYAMASSAPPPPTTFSLPNQENTRHVGPVLIDGVFFQLYRTGIGRVWKTLLEVWSRSEFSGRLIVIDRNRTAPRVPGINYVDMPAFDYDDASGDRFQLQKICDQYQAAVFISTYYTAPITTPSVILVHDMIPELFLDNPLDNPMWREKRYGLMHASQYITVSHNTANDLRRILPGIPEGRVTVAYNGVSLKYPGEAVIEDFKSRYNIKRPYFLMVGARKGYKNGELFFQAFRKLGTLRNKLAVVCTGPVKTLEADFAECLGGANVHMLEVDDSELEAVYAGAIALVYPSKYEGFGMPVVEAMACRCPVITTFAGSLREVAGDAALFVSEDNVVEMTKALKKVQAELVRKRLIESGLKRSSCFSWEKMADQVREVIGHIVSGFETKNKNRQLLSEEKQQLAMQYYSSGNFDEARKLLEKIHEADPDNFVVLHLLGSIYFLLKDWTRAEIMMLRAVHSDASVSETHSNLGGLYMNQGRLKEARRHLQKAISLNNELQVARDLLAHLDTIQAAV